MAGEFYTGMPGPLAIQQLQALSDRIGAVGNVANGGVVLSGSKYIVQVDKAYRTYDLPTLTGPFQLGVAGISTAVDGKTFKVRVRQDATGGRTLTADATIAFGTDLTSLSISATSNKKSYLLFDTDATTGKCDYLSHNRGF